MTGPDLATTGIGPLDIFLHGGVPHGFTTLLLAPAGAGSEIFAKQFASAPTGRTVFISTDETTREVSQAVKEAGWAFDHVEVVDIQTDFAKMMLQEQGPEEDRSAFDPRSLVENTSSRDLLRRRQTRSRSDYLGRLIEPFESGERPMRTVISSVDFFLSLYPLERVAAVLTALKAANSRVGGQLLVIMAKGAHGDKAERRLELLADCLIELEVNRKGTTFERFFLVRKVKNRPDSVGVSTYSLGPSGFTLETLERIV